MAVNKSPARFVFNLSDSQKKSYENCFPGLFPPSSENPLEEVGLHKQLSKTLEEFKARELSENSAIAKTREISNEKLVSDQNITPKSQKQKPSDVKRWASVVKAQKKLSTDTDINDKYLPDGLEISSEMFDCIFKTFPKCFESHKGFFVINDKMFYCNICSLKLDSVLSLSNHLKTRKHEDNAIEFFKTKMPAHLHFIMEFVSFYGSNLCCNLCRCKIPMSSSNAHETIVNIMAHNNDESHVSKRENQEKCNSAENVLKAISAASPVIVENLHFIERKMIPDFKCQLCKKNIIYNENVEILTQNFISHIKSVSHIKNQKAVEVLKLFGEANLTGKDNWAVVNGNIMCMYCKRELETNLQQLISHVNDAEHATNVLFTLGISSDFSKVSESDTLQENMMNEAKSVALNKPKDVKQSSKINHVPTQSEPGSRLKELLNTMPPDLKDVDYVIENEKGSITCLICNRVVPPSTYNLRTHLLGNKHKMNMELRNEVVHGESNKCFPGTSQNPNSEGSVKDQSKTLDAPPKLSKGLATRNLKHPGLRTDKGTTSCVICQCSLLNPDLADEHFASEEHKKKETLWLKNCPSCSSRNPFIQRVLKALPISVRTYRCRSVETIPASVLNHLFSLLLKDNQLVKNNEKFLVRNVDGKNSYCSLCKTLIPLSLDLDILESNIVSHIEGKRHEGCIAAKSGNALDESTSPRVARSLFDLPDELQKERKDSNVFNFEDFSKLICKETDKNTVEDPTKPFNAEVFISPGKKIIKDGVFVFGDEENKLEQESSQKKDVNTKSALPVADVSRLVKFEEETSEEVLIRRQKQIDYGKNTEGYARYCKLIPRRKRGIHHPVTPPKHLRCSRRTWDGMIRAWRRQLHSWDPPSSTLETDIRPLD